MQLEPHRLRIDTIVDGINHLDAVLEVFEKLLDIDGAESTLAEVKDIAEFAQTDDDVGAHAKDLFEQIESALGSLDLDTDFASKYELDEAVKRLKMLRDWLNEANLNYDMEVIRARQATGT